MQRLRDLIYIEIKVYPDVRIGDIKIILKTDKNWSFYIKSKYFRVIYKSSNLLSKILIKLKTHLDFSLSSSLLMKCLSRQWLQTYCT